MLAKHWLSEQSRVGDTVGAAVGTVGANVGAADVGAPVGSSVVVSDGARVGVAEGATVGDTVAARSRKYANGAPFAAQSFCAPVPIAACKENAEVDSQTLSSD